MKSRATLKFTSASSKASRTSRRASPALASEILPEAAQVPEGVLKLAA